MRDNPFTVNYTINGTIQVPSLSFNTLGTQNQVLSPDPMVGNNTVAIVNIVDVEGCIGNVITTEDILVRELPDLDLTIAETILSVLETTQNYLFLY